MAAPTQLPLFPQPASPRKAARMPWHAPRPPSRPTPGEIQRAEAVRSAPRQTIDYDGLFDEPLTPGPDVPDPLWDAYLDRLLGWGETS